ncbi:hypothetical protein [Pseudoblastomonas halimionae]|uniref:Uncharacterized protein n=1 Tax=Alteriqipengyuania halimionae TaxID=1926630 RepID=A0A6I4U882_9SPHN|nr:hypothetical protein [Alteriqipengyuania halimionae]MXP10467.1 hypothetical protein [Alteriqipengyuania halimionae]
MDLPAHPLAGLRLAISETLDTARVDRVSVIGPIDPITSDVLAEFEESGGALEILDCACGASPFSTGVGFRAWIMPTVANYYDAYRLLYGIRAMCVTQSTPFLVLRPQLASASARRDYYGGMPEVPKAWRHCSETCLIHGEAIERATVNGGLRNGVVTAIEDFIQEMWDEGTALAYSCLPPIGGFCALFDVDADWAAELAYRLTKFDHKPNIAAMSEKDLKNYLEIVDRSRRHTNGSAQ